MLLEVNVSYTADNQDIWIFIDISVLDGYLILAPGASEHDPGSLIPAYS